MLALMPARAVLFPATLAEIVALDERRTSFADGRN
jgi:hypothetical protein